MSKARLTPMIVVLVALIVSIGAANVSAATMTPQQTQQAQGLRTEAVNAATAAAHPEDVSGTYWWGSETWYSRSDVRAQANWWAVVGAAKAACGDAPLLLRAVCNATVGKYASWIYGKWMEANNNNECLWMKMTWTGQVIGIDAYACNWG